MRNTVAILGGLAALMLTGVLAPGCGGAGVDIPEGPMPDGGSFTGVWHSPQYGRMQMVQTGSNVVGEYTKDERAGRIQGTARGNVLRFEWSEERELVAGRPVVTRGRGFFRYSIDGAGDHIIQGRWGVDDDESGGGEWNAARDRRARPELSNQGEGGTSGGDDDFEEFDSAGGGSDSGGGGGSGSGSSSGGDDDLDLSDL